MSVRNSKQTLPVAPPASSKNTGGSSSGEIKVLYYQGPQIAPSASGNFQKHLKDSGLPIWITTYLDKQNGAKVEVSKALGRLSPGGHGIFNLHGSADGIHSVDSGLCASSDESTAKFLETLAKWHGSFGVQMSSAHLPFFHLISCKAGILRREIQPGSAQWKSAWVLLYAGKYASGGITQDRAQKSGLAYIRYCHQQGLPADPLKVFVLTGMRRGDCMTLLGGDLEGPVTWHAPRDVGDLENPDRVAELLDAHPKDLVRIAKVMREISDDELNLMPAANVCAHNIVHSRIARGDVQNVRKLFEVMPKLAKHKEPNGSNWLAPAISSVPKIEMVELLLRKGVSPSEKNLLGHSALTFAVDRHIDPVVGIPIVNALIDYGADPDESDAKGYPALMRAIYHGLADTVEVLLARGANPNVRYRKTSALKLATLNGNARIISLLKVYGAT